MGDGKKEKEEQEKKRKRSLSVDLSSDQEEENSTAASSPPPPPPPLLKHKTSLTKPSNFEVKCELTLEHENRFVPSINQQPETESITQHSSIHSAQELEDDDLDLFQQCGVATETGSHLLHPGPSRISAEELHSGQGNLRNEL